MSDKLCLILIGIFLLLFGIAAVTNVRIAAMETVMGLAALAAGSVCLIRALR